MTLIKLTRPAMEQRQDMGDVISRITLLEQEMQEAMEALKNGGRQVLRLRQVHRA